MSTKIEESMNKLGNELEDAGVFAFEDGDVTVGPLTKKFARVFGLEIRNDDGDISIVGQIKSLKVNGKEVDHAN